MGVKFSEVDFQRLQKDLEKCCLGEEVCGTCNKQECIIGYAQNCIEACLKDQVTYVLEGDEKIPFTDFKLYYEEEMAKGIAHTLKMCRSCSEEHYDQCLISVLRNCYEIGLFGETQPYTGSNFQYLHEIHEKKERVAEDIMEAFHAYSVPKVENR